jgi:hypothetical protein
MVTKTRTVSLVLLCFLTTPSPSDRVSSFHSCSVPLLPSLRCPIEGRLAIRSSGDRAAPSSRLHGDAPTFSVFDITHHHH